MSKKRSRLTVLLLIISLACILWFGFKYKWSFGCWAYYDHCTADKVYGLTEEECFQRSNSVAYYLKEQICLVKPKEKTKKSFVTRDYFKVDRCLDLGGRWDYESRTCRNGIPD